MHKTQIEKALNRLFVEENQRIVFWNDPDQEFAITLSLLELPEGVNLIRLDQMGALEVKILIEREKLLAGGIWCIITMEYFYDLGAAGFLFQKCRVWKPDIRGCGAIQDFRFQIAASRDLKRTKGFRGYNPLPQNMKGKLQFGSVGVSKRSFDICGPGQNFISALRGAS